MMILSIITLVLAPLIIFSIILAAIDFVVYGDKKFAKLNTVDIQKYNVIYSVGRDTTFLYVKDVSYSHPAIHKMVVSSSPLFKYWLSDDGGVVVRGSKLCKLIDQRFKEVANDTN